MGGSHALWRYHTQISKLKSRYAGGLYIPSTGLENGVKDTKPEWSRMNIFTAVYTLSGLCHNGIANPVVYGQYFIKGATRGRLASGTKQAVVVKKSDCKVEDSGTRT